MRDVSRDINVGVISTTSIWGWINEFESYPVAVPIIWIYILKIVSEERLWIATLFIFPVIFRKAKAVTRGVLKPKNLDCGYNREYNRVNRPIFEKCRYFGKPEVYT